MSEIIISEYRSKLFFNKVNKTNNCWNWIGAKSSPKNNLRGAFYNGKKQVKAHRFSWEMHYGEIPKNILVCHKCDNTLCVNPKHLFLGTQKDNIRDCVKKGRLHGLKMKIVCLRGHNKWGKMTRDFRGNKKRNCLDCHKLRGKKYRSKLCQR